MSTSPNRSTFTSYALCSPRALTETGQLEIWKWHVPPIPTEPNALGAAFLGTIYHGLEKWELLAVVAKKLVEWNPKEPGFFVELATQPDALNQFTRPTRF